MASIYFVLGFFGLAQQGNLWAKETSVDLYCLENAPFVVIGKILTIKEATFEEDFTHSEDNVTKVKIIKALKGAPVPRRISVLFNPRYSQDPRFKRNGTVLLFLNPSTAYHYIPILYGSVYFLETSEVDLWSKKIAQIMTALDELPSENSLKEYGFHNRSKCKIHFKVQGGGRGRYRQQEVDLAGAGTAKITLQPLGEKEPRTYDLRVSNEYIKNLLTEFARMDFFNVDYDKKEMVFDAPLESISFSYKNKTKTMEGYPPSYPSNTTAFSFQKISQNLYKLLTYVKEKEADSGHVYEFEDKSTKYMSLEQLEEKIDSGKLQKLFNKVIQNPERSNLIPYLISKIDFQDNTEWFQSEARVNIVRLLRILTQQDGGYDDEFIYKCNDKEIQKVKYFYKKTE
jgi:hypothetical protein